ncbi:MAG: diguanylate cyclase [Phyllobacteriaceae bacterium]|nr:diguanylate cyclase [Phyllobacteriaceae bacterium]
MFAFLDVLVGLGRDHAWLITANTILSVLLLAWLLRYRRLYMRAEAERRNKHNLIENLAEGIYTSSLDGKMLSANSALARLNGYASEAELLGAVRDIATEWYVDPARRATFRRALDRDGSVIDFVSEIRRHGTQERIWVSESARLVYDPIVGKPVYYEGSVRDISDDMRHFQLEERLEKLTQQAPGGFFQVLVDSKGVATAAYASSGLMPTLGHKGHFDPAAAFLWVHEDDRAEFISSRNSAQKTGSPWSHVFRVRGENGAIRWIQAFATPETTAEGVLWHGHLHDTTDRKARELEVADMAFFDTLTRLPNRRMLGERLPQAMAATARRRNHGALLFIDLDEFKTINDSFGHDAGDEYLVGVAECLRRSVRRNDIVSRFGGDEFIIVLDDIGEDIAVARDAARCVAAKILAGLKMGPRTGNLRHIASASIGIVVFNGTEPSGDELIKSADLAMYDAKKSGKGGIFVFDSGLLEQQSERYQLIGELQSAITWERLKLFMHPVMDDGGRIVGAEGLLRWPHETRGMIGPEDFIGLAEKAGLLNDMNKLALSIGFRTLANWQASKKTADLVLSINIGIPSLLAPDFAAHLRRMIDLHGIDPSRLTLELPAEILSKENNAVRARMAEVKALGVRFALDDFGSGHSSIENLKAFDFDR